MAVTRVDIGPRIFLRGPLVLVSTKKGLNNIRINTGVEKVPFVFVMKFCWVSNLLLGK